MNKAPRVIAIGLAIVILFAVIAYNAANPGKPNFVAWNENMTLGDKETAKHHYVMYTDLFATIFFFFLFRAIPAAYGGSHARGRIRAAALA